ncbi:MAG: hypothetical protein QM651_03600 [Rhodoblastus sp.]
MSSFTGALLDLHVILSLLEIPVGVALLFAMFGGRAPRRLTLAFLVLAALTSLTGFPLPPPGFDPARAIGLLSLALTAIAAYAYVVGHVQGAWRAIFVIAAVATLYLDVFVAIVQAFQKLAFLQPLAPTQSEPPFLIAQAICLAVFVAAGALAVTRIRRSAAIAG